MHHDLVSKLYSVYVGRCQSWETIACSRLRDSGESMNWEKERKKSEAAGHVLFSRSFSNLRAVPIIWEPGTG